MKTLYIIILSSLITFVFIFTVYFLITAMHHNTTSGKKSTPTPITTPASTIKPDNYPNPPVRSTQNVRINLDSNNYWDYDTSSSTNNEINLIASNVGKTGVFKIIYLDNDKILIKPYLDSNKYVYLDEASGNIKIMSLKDISIFDIKKYYTNCQFTLKIFGTGFYISPANDDNLSLNTVINPSGGNKQVVGVTIIPTEPARLWYFTPVLNF